jgi:hypothetical protein
MHSAGRERRTEGQGGRRTELQVGNAHSCYIRSWTMQFSGGDARETARESSVVARRLQPCILRRLRCGPCRMRTDHHQPDNRDYCTLFPPRLLSVLEPLAVPAASERARRAIGPRSEGWPVPLSVRTRPRPLDKTPTESSHCARQELYKDNLKDNLHRPAPASNSSICCVTPTNE